MNINKQTPIAPQIYVFEFIARYCTCTESICSIITGKGTEKCQYIKIINICINADVLFAKQGSESKTYADRLSCWIA